jgi:hypothetical protein
MKKISRTQTTLVVQTMMDKRTIAMRDHGMIGAISVLKQAHSSAARAVLM